MNKLLALLLFTSSCFCSNSRTSALTHASEPPNTDGSGAPISSNNPSSDRPAAMTPFESCDWIENKP